MTLNPETLKALEAIAEWLANGKCRKHGVSTPRAMCAECRYEALERAALAGLKQSAVFIGVDWAPCVCGHAEKEHTPTCAACLDESLGMKYGTKRCDRFNPQSDR